ncbi:hypothetical protein DPMN_108130 [Dreissena polymorpha]|uniref:Paraneoplastic antigen Ma-like C-terminal domain-containing protein n=1 Tax=Dreissena polymorpha TaxID=45954 RepID=A0A9D4QLR0_DREPO|nr:hypothetical protein DPMN_108130 [Dreissena polymorpha]
MTIPSNPPAPNILTVPAVIPVTNNAPTSVPLPPITPNLLTPLKRDVLTKLPKALQFDGRSNWPVFRGKFEGYAKLNKWSDEESAECLAWCLIGKASDFYAVLTEGNTKVQYADLMQRLEERFGAKELPATAQGRFQVAHQVSGESLEDWSDRVLMLAT